MNEEKGYEKLDAGAVFDEHKKEKQERNMRISGYCLTHEDSHEINGFIERNNVMERI